MVPVANKDDLFLYILSFFFYNVLLWKEVISFCGKIFFEIFFYAVDIKGSVQIRFSAVGENVEVIILGKLF